MKEDINKLEKRIDTLKSVLYKVIIANVLTSFLLIAIVLSVRKLETQLSESLESQIKHVDNTNQIICVQEKIIEVIKLQNQ